MTWRLPSATGRDALGRDPLPQVGRRGPGKYDTPDCVGGADNAEWPGHPGEKPVNRTSLDE